MRLDELNQASVDEFVEQLGGIFEHSPWVAERVAAQRPFASVDALHAVMCAAVASADENLQMALICAHPQLAGKAAIRGELTASRRTNNMAPDLTIVRPRNSPRSRGSMPTTMRASDFRSSLR